MTDRNVINGSRPVSTSLTLLHRVQQDEEEAWELLVELYAPMVYARCRQHWRLAAPDAENIGQEVFASVARTITDFKRHRTGSFRRWLRTIIDNKCCDHFRRQPLASGKGGTHAQKMLDNVAEETTLTTDTDNETSENAAIMRQAMSKVENEFSTRDWKIFWAIAVDGYERQDIASELNVTENVVYLAYSRIRKRIKEIYQDLIDDDLLKQEDE